MVTISATLNCKIDTNSNVFEIQDFTFEFKSMLQLFKTEGNLAYEYNPFKNYRTKYDLYKSDILGNLINISGEKIYCTINDMQLTKNNITSFIEVILPFLGYQTNNLNSDQISLLLKDNTKIVSSKVIILQRAKNLLDFETTSLGFDFKNPIQIECQPSYDGSVNLILNDGKNYPRLINSRFTVLPDDTYKIVDRKGNNDTNIYDEITLENDISLYKRITSIPKIEYTGLEYGGNFLTGNYVFYFKYADADGNETDFVEESGIVSCHIGNINSPRSIRSGILNENSYKMITFNITNLDQNYDYLKIFFVRSYCDENGSELSLAYSIDRQFPIKGTSTNLILSGFDSTSLSSIEEINQQFTIANSVKTQCQCQNILFLGNIYKPSINYKELEDLSLRVFPKANYIKNIGKLDYAYNDTTNNYAYYNTKNIYYNLSYWDKELYRFGIVYILKDYTLSSVFNIRGGDELIINTGQGDLNDIDYIQNNFKNYPVYDNETNRKYLEVNQENYLISDSTHNLDNSKGVSRFIFDEKDTNLNSFDQIRSIGVEFLFPEDVVFELKKHTVGYFIVRQKRIPTILGQAYTIGLDRNSHLPAVYGKLYDVGSEPDYFIESFLGSDRLLTHDFQKRMVNLTKSNSKNFTAIAGICPEYNLRTPFFNQLFTGDKFPISEDIIQPTKNYVEASLGNARHFYNDTYKYVLNNNRLIKDVKITGVEDNVKMKTSGTNRFSARAGEAVDASKISFINSDNKNDANTQISRGSYGPYIGLENYNETGKLINIHIPGYSLENIPNYFRIRYEDNSPYYAISPRTLFKELNFDVQNKIYYTNILYRGDCFIGNYTHRIVRNFQDPETPINDVILQPETWKDNMVFSDPKTYTKVNRGDVNAVQIGHWVTIQYRSNINLSMRTTDASNISEYSLVGNVRSFYPLASLSATSENKIPESFKLNSGFNSLTSDKFNFITPDVPYLKNQFDMRILYSDTHVNDSFKNGYRVFKTMNFKDYPRIYGGLTKIVEFQNSIIAIFEHGVARIVVRERTQVAQGDGGAVYLNSNNILPENLIMLSTNFGSSWIDSIVVTTDSVFGVDTIAKKIWQTDGNQFSLISDFRFQRFLNENISLKEAETQPLLGIRNVKGHYNEFKKDVLFTFYDDLYGTTEQVWNLCFNKDSQSFITFYSWVPSFMVNINNMPFSFDRDTSKLISKLSISNFNSVNADGITLTNNIIESNSNFIGTLKLVNRNFNFPENGVNIYKKFVLLKDNWKNYLNFEIRLENNNTDYNLYYINTYNTVKDLNLKSILLNISCEVSIVPKNINDISHYINNYSDYYTVNYGKLSNTIAIITKENLENLTTDFWKHGQAGIFDIADDIKPTNWYGKQHPFEFEFIVNDKPTTHKIFNNLKLLTNKTEPESFHYEIVGEVYEFAEDKKTMYFRQEATKELWQNLGSDIIYNKNYKRLTPYKNTKSNLFSLYYERKDTIDNIYDSYVTATSVGKDYANLTGSEIVFDKLLDEYRIATHVKGQNLDTYGRLRGNMQYKEDLWEVEIKPINIISKNETWSNPVPDLGKPSIAVPPILLNTIPPDITSPTIYENQLPNNIGLSKAENYFKYKFNDLAFDIETWSNRKETRIRDKYMKVKIRYSGENLAVISSIMTSYTISYS